MGKRTLRAHEAHRLLRNSTAAGVPEGEHCGFDFVIIVLMDPGTVRRRRFDDVQVLASWGSGGGAGESGCRAGMGKWPGVTTYKGARSWLLHLPAD